MKTSLLKYKRSKYKTRDIKHRAQKIQLWQTIEHPWESHFFRWAQARTCSTMANEMEVGRNSWTHGFVFGLTIWVCICAQVWICICGIVWWIVNVRVNGTKSVLSLTDELWTGCGLGHHTTCYCFGWRFAQQNSILGGQSISNIFKILLDVNGGAKF